MIFGATELFQLADKGRGGTARARSFPFTKRLNSLWRAGGRPVFRAEPHGAGARILADREVVLEILPGDATEPLGAARRWAAEIAQLFAAHKEGPRP